MREHLPQKPIPFSEKKITFLGGVDEEIDPHSWLNEPGYFLDSLQRPFRSALYDEQVYIASRMDMSPHQRTKHHHFFRLILRDEKQGEFGVVLSQHVPFFHELWISRLLPSICLQ
ncbi:hypothetical protein [Spirochaeta thermophila]|uniref:hypothetical protein n=1 Tax=Winmispira thermophila TaxID=154 RepID=UPI001FDF7CFF|nr:hypothetical protein [Spirochaeta thermophila]